MAYLVCFSQYFANKFNVRSYGNILKSNLLKQENRTSLLLHIFEDQTLVNLVSNDLSSIINSLISNLKVKSRDDFKGYFPQTAADSTLAPHPIDKELIYKTTLRILEDIIPKSFFTCNHNLKIFRKVVRCIVFSMNRHFMMLSSLERWDFSGIPWNTVPDLNSKQILTKLLYWILKHILSAIICLNFYVTTCKVDNDEHKLFFFVKSQWQSFYDRKLSNMLFHKVIKKYDSYCLGKKVKRQYGQYERMKLRATMKDIPKLHFVLKNNNAYRRIVRYKSDQRNNAERYKVRSRLNFIKEITQKKQENVEIQYQRLFKQWTCMGQPKLYFVKADLSNAFGAINKRRLIKILNEKYEHFQKKNTNNFVKQQFAQYYKDILNELHQPLMIRAGSTVYEWHEGLVQGYKYSPALSELYYTYLDELYFRELFMKHEQELMLFVRVVDDYLFITDSLETAHDFLKALSNYQNVNYEKTVVNFPHSQIKYSEQIIFLGYKYNTNTMHVSRANSVYTGQICYKIAITQAASNLPKFLENRIGQSGIPVNGHIFNFYYNNEELVWEHIFITFCLSANKFCTILSLLGVRDMKKYLLIYKQKVCVKLSNTIADTLRSNKWQGVLFMYCINHFKYLSLRALLLCAKKTANCDELIPYITIELTKCNCIFGAWHEHGSRISSSGEVKRNALKDVCRRSDLRVIFKKMNSLPEGVECYNKRYLK